MAYSFILSTDKLNRNGYKVLTSGIDILNYEKNPVLLVQHEHDSEECPPIGRVVNLRKMTINGGAALVGDLEFASTDEAKKYKQLVDDGAMSAVSICFRVRETSDKPEDMDAGQYWGTVISCELLEVSLVTIPGNADAVRMLDANNQLSTATAMITAENKPAGNITLAAGVVCSLSMALAKVEEQAAESTGGDGEEDAAADIDNDNLTLAFAISLLQAQAKQLERLSAAVAQAKETPPADGSHDNEPGEGGSETLEAKSKEEATPNSKRPSIYAEMQRQLAAAGLAQNDAPVKKTFDWYQRNAPQELLSIKQTQPDEYQRLVSEHLSSRK